MAPTQTLTKSSRRCATSRPSRSCPIDVRNQGVTILKSATSPLALFSLYSPKGTYDATFLANYAYININDPMSRVSGVGQVAIFGADKYAMRFWVRPDTLASLGDYRQRYHRRRSTIRIPSTPPAKSAPSPYHPGRSSPTRFARRAVCWTQRSLATSSFAPTRTAPSYG